jgi:hypothetical protein
MIIQNMMKKVEKAGVSNYFAEINKANTIMNNETDESEDALDQHIEIEKLIDKIDKLNELKEAADNLVVAFCEFDRAFKDYDRNEWERWKAGGKDCLLYTSDAADDM